MRQSISLPMAILINLNIMIGAGVFINTIPLARLSGALGSLVYIVVGLLMLPIIASMMYLLQLHSGGNFFRFTQSLGTVYGFASTWIYFVAKLASSALTIRLGATLLNDLVPALTILPTLGLECIILALFLALNFCNLRTSMAVQYLLIIGKIMPILFVIGAGLLFFNVSHAAGQLSSNVTGIIQGIPVALFALMGFEAACAISSRIHDPARNAPRALGIAALSALVIVCTYQFLYTHIMGDTTLMYHSFEDTIPIFLQRIVLGAPHIKHLLKIIFHVGMLAAVLGVSYGILFTNCWNLYALAERNLLPGSATLTRLNKFDVPFFCVLAEGLICLIYLTQLNAKLAFQQISGAGTVIAYALSALALIRYARTKSDTKMCFISIAALASCTILLSASINSFATNDLWPLTLISLLVLVGLFCYSARER